MDRALLATVILGVLFIPYVVEVFVQTRLQARFLAALPESARAALPPHPRRPALAFLGSWRFSLAFWRSIRRDEPDDPTDVRAIKRRMRASIRRAMLWGACWVGALAALLVTGWRPGVG